MISDIFERETVDIDREIKVSSKTGFPTLYKKKFIPITRKAEEHVLHEIKETNFNTQSQTIRNNEDTYQLENMEKVLKMTDEERKEAIDEVRSMLSENSINFLLKAANKDRLPKPTSKIEISYPSSKTLTDVLVENPHFDSELNELRMLQKEASVAERASISWTLLPSEEENLFGSNNNELTENTTYQNPSPSSTRNKKSILSQLFRSKSDRFDLEGRIIVGDQKSKILDEMRVSHENAWSSSDQSYLPQLTQLDHKAVVDMIFHTVESKPISIVATQKSVGSQPQDELKHHQADMDKAGYTMEELCELCRSEVARQRAIAWRSLQGILSTRELVVSLEAYGYLGDNPKTLSSHTGTEEPVRGGNERWTALRIGFTNICNFIFRLLESKVISEASHSVVLPIEMIGHEAIDLVKSGVVDAMLRLCASDFPTSIPFLLTRGLDALPGRRQNRVPYLRCVRAYLTSEPESRAREDIWSGIWGIYGSPSLPTPHMKRQRVSYESHQARCRSLSAEDEAEEEAEAGEGADGGEDGTKERFSPLERFARKCRWARADILLGGSRAAPYTEGGDKGWSLLDALCVAVEDSMLSLGECTSAMQGKQQGADDRDLGETVERWRALLSLHSQTFDAGFLALKTLADVVPDCTEETRLRIFKSVVMKLWSRASIRVDLGAITGNSAELGHVAIHRNFEKHWWRLIVEVARGNREAAQWLCEKDILGDILSRVVESLVSRPELGTPGSDDDSVQSLHHSNNGLKYLIKEEEEVILWQLRFWRVCLGYGLVGSLPLLIDLWMAAQEHKSRGGVTEGVVPLSLETNSEDVSVSTLASAPINSLSSCLGDLLLDISANVTVELFWLFEAAATHCAGRLDQAVDTLKLTSVSNINLDGLEIVTDVARILFLIAKKEINILQLQLNAITIAESGPQLQVATAALYFLGSLLGVLPPDLLLKGGKSPLHGPFMGLWQSIELGCTSLCTAVLNYASCVTISPSGNFAAGLTGTDTEIENPSPFLAEKITFLENNRVLAVVLGDSMTSFVRSAAAMTVNYSSLERLVDVSSTLSLSMPVENLWFHDGLVLAWLRWTLSVRTHGGNISSYILKQGPLHRIRQVKDVVASGLYQWQRSRLHSAARLYATNIVLLDFINTSTMNANQSPPGIANLGEVVNSVVQTLPLLAPGFSPQIQFLLQFLLSTWSQGKDLRNVSKEIVAGSTFLDRCLDVLLTANIQLHNSAWTSTCRNATRGYAADGRSLDMWTQSAPPVTIDYDWMGSLFLNLHGFELWDWLRVMASVITDVLTIYADVDIFRSCQTAVNILQALLASVCEGDSWRWTIMTSTNTGDSTVELSEISYVVALEIPEDVEEAYELIITACLKHIHGQPPDYLSYWLNESCEVNRKRRLKLMEESPEVVSHSNIPSGTRLSFSKSAGPRGTSASLDFAAQLVDAALAPLLSHRLHAASLIPLLYTGFPWQLRERVWRELAALRLVHLLESSVLVDCLPALVCHAETSMAVSNSILAAVLSARSSSERNSLPFSLAIHQLSSFVFDIRTSQSILSNQSPRKRLLREILSEDSKVANGIVVDLLAFGTVCEEIPKIERYDVNKSEIWEEARHKMMQMWSEVRRLDEGEDCSKEKISNLTNRFEVDLGNKIVDLMIIYRPSLMKR